MSTAPASISTHSQQTFYRRQLPQSCIMFSSPEGRQMFKKSLELGYGEAFYPLIEQYHTQNDPSFCGLGTLTMILNALNVDPGRIWKGVWRWFSEEMLDCCVDIEKVKQTGITMEEFVCISQCNGAEARVFRDGDLIQNEKQSSCNSCIKEQDGINSESESKSNIMVDIELFRKHVMNSCKATCQLEDGCEFGFVAVSYSRKIVGQTGSGHFSPIGAYYPSIDGKSDMVLILDVARFKYPPHWVSVDLLYQAMNTPDSLTGTKRGWVLLSRTKNNILNTTQLVSLSPGASVSTMGRTISTLIRELNQFFDQLNEKITASKKQNLDDEIIENNEIKVNISQFDENTKIDWMNTVLQITHRHMSNYLTISEQFKEQIEIVLQKSKNLITEEIQTTPITMSIPLQPTEQIQLLTKFVYELMTTEIYNLISKSKENLNDIEKVLYTLILMSLPIENNIPWDASIPISKREVFSIQNEIDKLKLQYKAMLCFPNNKCKQGKCSKCH